MTHDIEWLGLKRVAELLDQSHRTAERTVCRPGFPVAAPRSRIWARYLDPRLTMVGMK